MKQEKSLKKKWPLVIILSAGLFVIAGGIAWFMNKQNSKSIDPDLSDTDYNDEWAQGPDNAKVILVEYADFQCPASKRVTGLVKSLLIKYPKDLRFIYRHYPLSTHAEAQAAAEAAEAAGTQGKFWEMHDALFTNQDFLSAEIFRRLAADLRLDVSRFIKEMNENTYQKQVLDDYQSGRASNVKATPTFFINGKMYQETYSLQGFTKAIEAEITAK